MRCTSRRSQAPSSTSARTALCPPSRRASGSSASVFVIIVIGRLSVWGWSLRRTGRRSQGLLAPILTSAALFGVYCLLTYFPDLDLKTLLGAYFWLLATVAVSGNLKLPLNRWVGSLTGGLTWRLGLPKWLGAVDVNTGDMVTEVDVSPFDLVALGIGLCLATADFQSGHANFTLNNLIATLIAVDVLQLVGLNSYRTAVALSGAPTVPTVPNGVRAGPSPRHLAGLLCILVLLRDDVPVTLRGYGRAAQRGCYSTTSSGCSARRP